MAEKKNETGIKRDYESPIISEEEVFERSVLTGDNKTPAEEGDDEDCENNPVLS